MTKVEQINSAIELIEEAQRLVEDALFGETQLEAEYNSYGRFGFNQLLNNGNPYDRGLSDLITDLEKKDDKRR